MEPLAEQEIKVPFDILFTGRHNTDYTKPISHQQRTRGIHYAQHLPTKIDYLVKALNTEESVLIRDYLRKNFTDQVISIDLRGQYQLPNVKDDVVELSIPLVLTVRGSGPPRNMRPGVIKANIQAAQEELKRIVIEYLNKPVIGSRPIFDGAHVDIAFPSGSATAGGGHRRTRKARKDRKNRNATRRSKAHQRAHRRG